MGQVFGVFIRSCQFRECLVEVLLYVNHLYVYIQIIFCV